VTYLSPPKLPTIGAEAPVSPTPAGLLDELASCSASQNVLRWSHSFATTVEKIARLKASTRFGQPIVSMTPEKEHLGTFTAMAAYATT